MIELTPNECRVLGVLVEKALTTPSQYPMTLNAIVNGCNQKSNRHPVTSLDEDTALRALDGLRQKELSREVMLSGSRVAKFRHTAREGLAVDTNELVVLTELLLRGPQTLGEIRGRASRMHPLESIEIVNNICEHLSTRDEPLVQSIPPASGSRAGRFAQVLCPTLHPLDAPVASVPAAAAPADNRVAELERRLAALENEVERMKVVIESLGRSTGIGAVD